MLNMLTSPLNKTILLKPLVNKANGLLHLLPHYKYASISGILTIAPWLLTTGFWDDTGAWDDSATWLELFTPSDLFASGEQGVWYDPSDMSTMFQDAAGTTPVTAVEQPVGRILDKSGRGNHATQPTATARPVLSARYNLLTKTEQFDDVVWTKNNVTVTANAITAPDGTLTADLIVPFNATAASYVLYTFPGQTTTYANRVSVKNAGKNFIQIMSGFGSSVVAYANVNLTTLATSGAGVTATDAGNGWVDIIFTAPRFEGVSYLLIYVVDSLAAGQSAATVGNGADGIYIWGASIVPANQANLPYQRVNTATDYDADPAKFKPYLRFDGVDDSLVTSTIAFSAGAATSWLGMRNTGGTQWVPIWRTADPGGGYWAVAQQGSDVSPSGNSPASNRVNAVALSPNTRGELYTRASNTTTVITTDNLTLPGGSLSIGGYPGFQLSANFYSLIVHGAATDAATIAATEAWVNSKTGAY